MVNPGELLFEVLTPAGFTVRVSHSYWGIVSTVKHPIMAGQEDSVKQTLQTPDEIRRSRTDETVYLFYKEERPQRWNCAVAKRLNGDGFLITGNNSAV